MRLQEPHHFVLLYIQGSYTFFNQKFKDFSRPFKDTFFHFLRTQEGQNQAHVMPHQILKVESVPIFVSDTWEALLDKTCNTKFQGLSGTDCNFQGLLRPWIFILKFKDFQGLSRRVRTLYIDCTWQWIWHYTRNRSTNQIAGNSVQL